MDLPLYSTKPSIVRVLIPKIFKLIGLAVLLYTGVWLNLFFMKIKIPSYINYLIIAIIFVLVLIEALFTYMQTLKDKYYFFAGRVEFRGKLAKTLDFRYVTNMSVSKDLVDKVLGTGTIVVQPDFRVENVSNCDQVFSYLQQLVQRIRHPLLQQQQSFNR